MSRMIEDLQHDYELMKERLSARGQQRLEATIAGADEQEFVFSEEDSLAILNFLAAANARFKVGA